MVEWYFIQLNDMQSLVVNGKVLDFRYKKITDSISAFYIGSIYVGQVFKMHKRAWSVVAKTPNKICPVDGFARRRDAAEFLLKLEGLST